MIIRLDRRYLAIFYEVQEEGRRHTRNRRASQHDAAIAHFSAKAWRILQHQGPGCTDRRKQACVLFQRPRPPSVVEGGVEDHLAIDGSLHGL